jgi:acetyl/propionyl-CoA carboxylase alpha subunit
MLRALAETRIQGIQTSVPFFVSLLNDPRVVKNDVSTQFLDGYKYTPPAPEEGAQELALTAAVLEALEETKAVRPQVRGAAPAPWRSARPTHGVRS